MRDKLEVENIIIAIIRRYIDDEDAKVERSTRLITDLGVDSLDLLDISFDLEQELQVSIPIDEWTDGKNISAEEFVELLTVGQIVDHIHNEEAR